MPCLGWRSFVAPSHLIPLITALLLFVGSFTVSGSCFSMFFSKATTVALGLLTQHAYSHIAPVPAKRDLWQPSVASKWQIMIKNNISISLQDTLTPADVNIWDIDLFNTPADVISGLHGLGKKVICYFSAGSGEDWRPDYSQIPAADLGQDLGCWPGEKWLNVRSEAVWNVMAKRIALASQKGCDGVDPDNMDGYSNGGGGFSLTQSDSIKYIKRIAAEAASYGMSTGLKNAQEILSSVSSEVQFAVNEQCASGGDCTSYNSFLDRGKPVFHIEYADYTINADGSVALSSSALPGSSTDQILASYCLQNADSERKGKGAALAVAPKVHAKALGQQLSTVTKVLLLDGFVIYCDKSWAISDTVNVGTGGPNAGYCDNKKKTGHLKGNL